MMRAITKKVADITRCVRCFGESAASQFPSRPARSAALSLMLAGGILSAAGGLVGCTAKAGDRLNPDQWTPPATESRVNDGVLFVHTKLMEVRTTGSGVPVLRFVECRHYAKEHKKLIQTGVSDAGLPILRFVPGDYCILVGAEVGAPNPATVQIHKASLVNVPTAIANLAVTSVRPTWGAHFLGHAMTYNQQYTCDKFGPACRVALAIQAAENLKGDCEAYHYNTDGSLDWGYFQINSVHLTRRGVNLRDLLDCKANIDFAYQLYREEGFQPWSTYVSGDYRKFLDDSLRLVAPESRHSPESLLLADIF